MAVAAEEMAPWEQHAAVIAIPRFDYKAPSSLLEASHSGFLITCPIKREKSATKEAISILSKFINSCKEVGNEQSVNVDDGGSGEGSVPSEEPDELCIVAKKRKLFPEKNQDCAACDEANADDGNNLSNSCENEERETSGSNKSNSVSEYRPLSLIKLTRSGLVLFIFRESNYLQPANILTSILASLQSGDLKPVQWCHRILPVQATCSLKEKELQNVVSNLIRQYLENDKLKLSTPLKFAVSYNRRGIDDIEMKTHKHCMKNSENVALLDRNKCFTKVAAAVKNVVEDSIVDLKSPELVVFVELLPLSGIAQGSVVAAVSVLPHDLVTVKPRLCVKALSSDSKKGPKVKGAT